MNPGSKEAVAEGCTCPISDNANGDGVGGGLYWVNENCPVHGRDRVIVLNSAGFSKSTSRRIAEQMKGLSDDEVNEFLKRHLEKEEGNGNNKEDRVGSSSKG